MKPCSACAERDAVTAGMCHRCYQYVWAWSQRGVAYTKLRRRQDLLDHIRPANVRRLRRRA